MSKFNYKYKAPSVMEKKEIEIIRNQYLPKNESLSKVEELMMLDRKVKNIPLILGLSFGIVGVLLFGTGLTFFLEWFSIWYFGIPFIIIGVITMIIAYPIYNKTLAKRKEKYGKRILELTEELLID